MSKKQKEQRAAKRDEREKKQAQRVINWIVGALVLLFAVAIVITMTVR